MNHKERMLSGLPYKAWLDGLEEERLENKKKVYRFNHMPPEEWDSREDLLREILLTQPDDSKVAIMHALTRFATGKALPSLLEGYHNTKNPHVRFEALRCIYNYGEEGKKLFRELEENAPEADRKFFGFFNNPITLEKIRLDKEQAYHPSVETVYNESSF